MRNPLHRRYGRQLVHDAGKYLGIFLLLLVTVAFVSSFLMSTSSIRRILDDFLGTCSLEDARLEVQEPLTGGQLAAVEAYPVTVHWLFSRDVPCPVDGKEATVRVYEDRTDLDRAAYYDGSAPSTPGEAALDRTFAMHHGIAVGDTVSLGGRAFTVSGLMVLPDYTTLMASNNDIVMDTITFAVALVTPDGFEALAGTPVSHTYGLTFDDPGLGLADRVAVEQDIAGTLVEEGAVPVSLVDRDQNQGITYATDDMEGDSAMYLALGYLLVGIMGFVFIVLTDATIEQESSVIGTLLASGWRRGEVLRHYLLLPAAVGLVAVALGNALGYTVLAGPVSGLYYNSYSFPPFHPYFDPEAFVLTSVVPYLLLVGITAAGLLRRLRCTPLAFLRHEVGRPRRRRSVRLPARWGFVARFRARVALRNLPTYGILFLGSCAGMILLVFGLGILPVFQSYCEARAHSVPAEHIYTLKAPLELRMTDEQRELRDRVGELQEASSAMDVLESGGDGLASGARTLDDGAATAREGAQTLAEACGELSSGAARLAEGSDAFDRGLADAGAQQLAAGDAVDLPAAQASYEQSLAAYVAAAAQAAATGADPATDPAIQAAATSLSQALQGLVGAAAEKGGRQGAAEALAQARESYTALASGIDALADGAPAVEEGARGLADGLGDLQEGAGSLAEGIGAYTGGVEALVGTAREQAAGAGDGLASGYHPVADKDANTQSAVDQAEKVCIASLETARPGGAGQEPVTVYGVEPGSRYWTAVDVSDGSVVVGAGLAEKCGLEPGGTVVLYDKFEDRYLALPVDAVTGDGTDTAVYMARETFNEAFGHDGGWFNGYASDEPLSIDADCLAGELTPDDMRRVGDQMMDSFSDVVQLVVLIAVLVFFVVMYLLTKTVLDHSARAIAYMKVFGYRDREVDRLYLASVTLMVAASLVVSLPVVLALVTAVFKAMLASYPGNFVIAFSPDILVRCLLLSFGTYLAVALIHMRAIRRVPPALALKVQE